ncbi:MAG: c-type cytochrome [Myxococcales bacterium]|nr:c-type cytochrome [Myxococcales bacterium]
MARQELLSSLGLLGIVAACSGAAIQLEEAVAAPVARPASASSGLAEPASCARKGSTRGGAPLSSSGQGGTVALSSWGNQVVAYVLHEDDRAIHAIDIESGMQLGVTPLDGAPASLLVLGDGRVAVTLRDENKLQLLEPGATPGDTFAVRCSLDVPSEPFGLATSPDGATLAVTSAWAHKVLAFDVATMKLRAEVDVPREPRAVVVDDDGERAFVAHVVDAKMSVVDLPTASSASPSVRTIDLRAKKSGQLQAGCQGFALAKAVSALPTHAGQPGTPASSEKPPLRGAAPPAPGEPGKAAPPTSPTAPKAPDSGVPQVEARVFAPMVIVDPGEVEQASSGGYGSPERGPTERPLVSVVDAGAERPMTRTAAGDALVSTDACLLPRAAAFDAGSQSLLVVCLGSNMVLRLDGRAVDPSRRQLASFRVPAGPTGIALDEQRGRAVVFSQFASALTVVSIADGKSREISVPAILSRMPAAQLLRGRALFHATNDGRISGDGRACASCHPDGRDDAITWQTPDGPRQTIMLAGRLAGSAPFGWDGDKSTVRAHVTDTLARLRGTGMAVLSADRADFEDLLAYVGAMKAPKVAPDAARAALIARGEELFQDETTSCAACHPAGRTNGKAVVVSTGATKIDTPSLTGVAGTAPYFHDGRFATLEELLKSPDHFMGKTVQLTRKDRVALAAYLETL